ncbi:MAG: hypothetical protein MMC33_003066 [Icmadophila ericetorum]|nr:hypothetical protein [Icmadophila ericetorum]
MAEASTEYIAVGGNRHSTAADWDSTTGLLAFGSDRNVALWEPLNKFGQGVQHLLHGHTGTVNAVKFFLTRPPDTGVILSGSADQTICIWVSDLQSSLNYSCKAVLTGHASSINCLAVLTGSSIFVSGAADGRVGVYRLKISLEAIESELIQSIRIVPRLFPLTLALAELGTRKSLVLAVGGTKNIVQIYTSVEAEDQISFSLQATLAGHEGWIRSLDFVKSTVGEGNELLLASASQDKYIRIWKICPEGRHLVDASSQIFSVSETNQSLSNKTYRLATADCTYLVSFEALLLGHDDWIYTVSWIHTAGAVKLLSASADNSLAIWESDAGSGIWIPTSRLGEISAQKGSTTATGSTGGFWIGLWSSKGNSIASLGRTGTWRLWKHEREENRWIQVPGVSGHVKAVKGIAWSTDGTYLLSTSSDQTTRLHAEWKQNSSRSWHEFARPQIHGYDLNCIATTSPSQFVSGADEKLLRVFDEPRAVAGVLQALCGISSNLREGAPEIASIPVLGLSNKGAEASDDKERDAEAGIDRDETGQTVFTTSMSTLDQGHPPLEDQLARHTLFPEIEKLYGHGYELSAVAASHDGSTIATACKATSLNHAVIRLYETRGWREVKPSLKFHTLTATCLSYSKDDEYLLSVGRDRQWAVYQKGKSNHVSYELRYSNPKGHNRMVLSAAWAPVSADRIFVTAGRDKTVKIWRLEGERFEFVNSITTTTAATSVDFLPTLIADQIILGVGTEDGELSIHRLSSHLLEVQASHMIDRKFCPSNAITQIAWRPPQKHPSSNGPDINGEQLKDNRLAIASDDSSLRILSFRLLPFL